MAIKNLVLFTCDQNRVTHNTLIHCQLDWQTLIDIDIVFSDSNTLPMLFMSEKIKTIFILIYTPKGQKDMKRRIAGVPMECDEGEVKGIAAQMANDVGIKMQWHSPEEFRKILPIDKAQREAIKQMLRS